MKKIIMIILLFASIGFCIESSRSIDTQEYILGNGHNVSLFNNTLTNVPERVVKAIIKVKDQPGKEYRVYVLKELPSAIKRFNLKNYSMILITNENDFIYYKLQQDKKTEKIVKAEKLKDITNVKENDKK